MQPEVFVEDVLEGSPKGPVGHEVVLVVYCAPPTNGAGQAEVELLDPGVQVTG